MKVKIPVSNKEFEIIDTLTRKELKEVGRYMAEFVGFDDRLAKASQDELAKMVADIEARSPEADAFMFRIFSRCVAGMSKGYFEEDMRSIEALILFNAIWRASTEIPLEYVKPSASSSAGA